jgi:hypothetical protein
LDVPRPSGASLDGVFGMVEMFPVMDRSDVETGLQALAQQQ